MALPAGSYIEIDFGPTLGPKWAPHTQGPGRLIKVAYGPNEGAKWILYETAEALPVGYLIEVNIGGFETKWYDATSI